MSKAIVPTGRSLKQIESHIQKCAEQVRKNGIEIGRDLIEIRDDHRWKDAGFDSFSKYIEAKAHELIGQTPRSAYRLVQCAEIEAKITDNAVSNMQAKHFEELGRLAPNKGKVDDRGMSKDISALKPATIKRVLNNAAKHARNGTGSDAISVRDIQKAVDKELGIDRAKIRKENARQEEQEREQRQREADERMELTNYLKRESAHTQMVLRHLSKVPAEGWEWLAKRSPNLAERFARDCDELAEFLRS